MNRSLPHYVLLSCLFLSFNFFSAHAQNLLTKNIAVNKKSVFNNASLEKTAPTTQPDAAIYTNRLNTEGLRFTENKGQIADLKGKLRSDVLFTAHNSGAKLFLAANGISYQFSRQFIKQVADNKLPTKFQHNDIDSTQFYRVDVKLVGANLHSDIIKEGEGSGVENFYLAHCPNGILNVKNYSKITYKNVYPDIDWVVYSKEGKLEYDFVVNPGGNVTDIKLQYDGAEKISLDNKGAVTIETRLGSVSEHKPASFMADGKSVESKFVLEGNVLRFDVKDWDKSQVLTIDPEIVWATYYGGSNSDRGYSCTTDSLGNVYLGGNTSSTDGIAFNGFQNTYNTSVDGNGDAFLVKFDEFGNRLWATYYGGENSDYVNSCAVDKSGNIYLAGYSFSKTGISYNGFQNSYIGNYDAFLIKFNSSGSRLWGTYYGGESNNPGNSCTTDNSGNVYLAGSTSSSTGIASNGYQNTYNGSNDAFLVKFDSTGARLWGTYYGGKGTEAGNYCVTDGSNIYLTGHTNSSTDIASKGFQNTYNSGGDAYLVKFDSMGIRLWGTYYGGNGTDDGYTCTTDKFKNVYLAGFTTSNNDIAFNGFQNTISIDSRDAFLVKFDSTGARLWGTYYGGGNDEAATSCTVDQIGNIYLTGYTYSKSGIAFNGFQDTIGKSGNADAFLIKFDLTGARLWGTYYGGALTDYSYSCMTDKSGYIYIAGYTLSSTNIAKNGFSDTLFGSEDAFLAKILDNGTFPLHLLSFTASLQNKAVNLAWQTAQEVNTSYFVVERSKDGNNYTSLQQVTAGSHNGTYTTTDNSPLSGKSLYRLKIVDKDGKITYSSSVPISYIIKNIVTVSPNPARDKITVRLQSISNAKASIRISDVNGKIVYTKQLPVTLGINTLSFPVASFAKGTYLLTIVQGNDKQTVKWIKE